MKPVATGEKGGESSMFKHYIAELSHGFWWKAILSSIGAFVATVNGFYGELVWGFLSLFCIDWITGVLKSLHNGIPFSSKRLRASVTKLGAYMLAITALIISSHYEPSFRSVVDVCYYYIIFTELKSILENVQELGVKLPTLVKKKVDDQLDDLDRGEQDDKDVEK